jgi:hypothetical protein
MKLDATQSKKSLELIGSCVGLKDECQKSLKQMKQHWLILHCMKGPNQGYLPRLINTFIPR